MKFANEDEKLKIGRTLASIKFFAELNLNKDLTPKDRFIYATKIIELIGTLAVLIGGPGYALQIPYYEAVMKAALMEGQETDEKKNDKSEES